MISMKNAGQRGFGILRRTARRSGRLGTRIASDTFGLLQRGRETAKEGAGRMAASMGTDER
jgi:hypothetical protein